MNTSLLHRKISADLIDQICNELDLTPPRMNYKLGTDTWVSYGDGQVQVYDRNYRVGTVHLEPAAHPSTARFHFERDTLGTRADRAIHEAVSGTAVIDQSYVQDLKDLP